MTIPAFTSAGVLPPFTGAPAANTSRSPYVVTLPSVVERFATSKERCEILDGLLRHRAELHRLGFVVGYQWLDGSFCEERSVEPKDIDVVTFYAIPSGLDVAAFNKLVNNNLKLFHPDQTFASFKCDAYFVKLETADAAKVALVSYWFGLFSHRRTDLAWKGILQIQLSPADDAAAATELAAARKRFP